MEKQAKAVSTPETLTSALTSMGFTKAFTSQHTNEISYTFTQTGSDDFLSAKIFQDKISLSWNTITLEDSFPTDSWTFEPDAFDETIIASVKAAFKFRTAIHNRLCARIPSLTMNDIEKPIEIEGIKIDYTLSDVINHLIRDNIYSSEDCPFGIICTEKPNTAISSLLEMPAEMPCDKITVTVVTYEPDTADKTTSTLQIKPKDSTWRSIYKASAELLEQAAEVRGQIYHEGISIEDGIYTLNYGT